MNMPANASLEEAIKYHLELNEDQKEYLLNELQDYIDDMVEEAIYQHDKNKWVEIIPNNEKTLPATYESYDFAGKPITTSYTVITNMGVGTYKNGEWVTAKSDVSETDKGLQGVTHWMSVPEYDYY